MAVNAQGQIVNEQGVPTGGQVDVGTGALTTAPPASSAPTSPTPLPNTPPAPSTTINVNAGAPPEQKPATGAPTGTAPLVMPTNGSVVDLLNMAGQDSSFASRQQLAQQYGMQGYTGTATQNIDLSKKYLDAFNANKGTKVPDTGAQASSALDGYFKDNAQEVQEDPQRAFFDQYMQMNPIVKTMYDTINTELSRPVTATSFSDEYKKLLGEQGIPGLQTELMNVNNIMEGTEDDIRDEITKVGGFATESQVQDLKGARNKTLLKQANTLQQQLALKQDYVDQIMQFSQLDRAQVEKDVDKRLGLTEKLAKIQEGMTSAAKENYKTIVDKVGYGGLATALGEDKRAMKLAEKTLGLPTGALSNPAFLNATVTTKGTATASVQEYKYAKAQGYKGTYIDYQNEDANRKKSIASAGVAGGGLTPSQVNSTVNTIAGAFDNEAIVKGYNTVQEGYQTIKNIGVNTKSPADDIAFIYAFAKIMDPNSVVREGEYNTIQKYAQTWADNFGFKANRVYSNTNFLTADAKQKMLNTLKSKVDTVTSQYKNVEKEYQRQINDAYQGKPRQITNYSTESGGGTTGMTPMTGPDGKRYNVPSNQVEAMKKAGGKTI